jgi:hypothetical protein
MITSAMFAAASCASESGGGGTGGRTAGTGGASGSGGVTGSGGTSAGTGGSNPGSGGIVGSGGAPAGTGGGAGSSGSGGAGSGGIGSGGAAGGASGSGGRGGAAGGTGSGGGAGGLNGQCPAGAIFCADFESGGVMPGSAQFFPDYLRTSISSYLSIDSTIHSRGAASLKVAGTGFSQMLGVATGTTTFWSRVYFRMDRDSAMGHNTYYEAATGNGSPNDGRHIRIGEYFCQLVAGRDSPDESVLSNGGTYMCMGGTRLAANTWYCLETYFNGPASEVRVFVNGAEIPQLHITNYSYTYTMFKFGYEAYGGPAGNFWYDDVAVATQRVGCYPP